MKYNRDDDQFIDFIDDEDKQTSKRKHPKSKFSKEEDERLKKIVAMNPTMNWNKISNKMPGRNARQCKDRWENYLNPAINKSPFSLEEDILLLEKYNELGSKWVLISKHFNNRSDTCIKSRYLVLKRRGITLEFLRTFNYQTELSTKKRVSRKSHKLLAEKIQIQLAYQQQMVKMQNSMMRQIMQNDIKKETIKPLKNYEQKEEVEKRKVDSVAEAPLDFWNDTDIFSSQFDFDPFYDI